MEWNKRSAYLLVRADAAAAEKAWEKVQGWNETIGTWLVTGPWDMMVWVDARSWDEVYEKVASLRHIKGVRSTSTHFVYRGVKNGKWWWDWKVGSWVFLRGNHLNGEIKQMGRWNWAGSVASVPGDWDYVAWAGGKDYNEVFRHIWELNKSGWHTQTLVPIRSWWNKNWKGWWWN